MTEERALTRFNGNMAIKPAVDLVLIIDRSGSMMGNEQAINKYYKEMLQSAMTSGRQVTLTTVLFDDNNSIELACDGQRIQNAGPLNYAIGGATALYDAYGAAIMYENKRKTDPKNPYPYADVLYLAMTDGQENDSIKFDLDKIRTLILDERERGTKGGMGRREFAQITEFGVDKIKMGEEFMLEDQAMQTFFRGEKGLRALFQTVMLALKNMIEDRRITNKWKELSDRLPIGKLSLGQLKAVAESGEKMMVSNDSAMAELEQLSDGGLTPEFQKLYTEVYARTKEVNASLEELSRDPELMEMMDMYIGKNSGTVDSSYEKAVSNEFAIVSTELHSDLMTLKKAAGVDFVTALQKYDDDIKRLKSIPAICARMRQEIVNDNRLDTKARIVAASQAREFDDIIDMVFTTQMTSIRANPDVQTMRALTSEPVVQMLSGNPSYNKFSELCKYLRAHPPQQKLKSTAKPHNQQERDATRGN